MAKDTKQEEPKPKTAAAAKAGAPAEAPAQKKSKAKLFIILGVVLLLAGGGGFAAWRVLGAKKASAAAAAAAVADSAAGDAAKPDATPAEEMKDAAKDAKKDPPKEPKKDAASGKEPKEGKDAKTGKEAAADPNPLEFPLDAVLVNLRDSKTGGLNVQFWVHAKDANARAAIEKAHFQIHGALIELISGKNSTDLQAEEGKDLLKREVKKKLDELLGPGLVEDLGYVQFTFFRG